MIYIQETTVWEHSWVPNHIYYVTDDKRKAVGYIRSGTTEYIKFSKPMTLDIRGRKFITLRRGESDSVYFAPPPKEAESQNVITVAGSGGKTYQITTTRGRMVCSCPGFQFRNKCKHVTAVT